MSNGGNGGYQKPSQLVEITRSFTYKVNRGNYESSDFFMAQNAECRAEDAEKVSEALHDFCKRQVLKAVQQFKEEMNAHNDPRSR